MAYDAESMIRSVVAALRQKPRCTLGELSAMVGAHRHTIENVLRARGFDFLALRAALIVRMAEELRKSRPELSKKQVAFKLEPIS